MPARNASPPIAPHTARFTRWGRWLAFLLLTGHLIFCHGCHGDEDNELCAPPHKIEVNGPLQLNCTVDQPEAPARVSFYPR